MAFTKYFFERVNAAYMHPDATIIPALSTEECKSCESLQSTVEGYVARGHRMESTPTAPITGLKMRSPLPVERVMVQFTLTQNAVDVVDASGKSIDKQAQGQRSQIAVLVWREGRWFMNGLAAA
jgi:hypothetical protein